MVFAGGEQEVKTPEKYTLAKREGACMNGLRSTIGIYGFHEYKL